jgi:hypothetical protein
MVEIGRELAGNIIGSAPNFDIDPCSAKAIDALARNLWVGICKRDHDSRHSGVDHRVGTGRGESMMRAGLEGHIEG